MRARRSRLSAFVVISLIAAVLGSGPSADARRRRQPLRAESHSCGDTISGSFRLSNNLECTTGPALTVTASKITIDLGGHRLSGGVGATGIVIASPVSGTTLKNGIIAGFATGVLLNHSTRNVLSNLLIEVGSAGAAGIAMVASDKNHVQNDVLIGSSGGSSVFVGTGSDGNIITKNRFFGGIAAISLNGTSGAGNQVTGTQVSKNAIVGTTSAGISVAAESIATRVTSNAVTGSGGAAVNLSAGATGTRILKNALRGNGEGVFVSGSPSNVITHNTITGSAGDGIGVSGSTGLVATKNTIEGNVGNGIHVLDTGSTGGTIKGNKLIENGFMGINSAATDGTVTNNIANFNGYLNGITTTTNFGISAPTAKKNRAQGNASGTSGNECNPASACRGRHVAAPPLQPCGAVSQSITLRNPLDCLAGDALVPNADGLKLHLGFFRISGAPTAASVNAGARNNISIDGGVLADSGTGLELGGHGESVTGALIVGSSGGGMRLSGVSNSSFSRDTITRAGTGGDGVDVINGGGTNTFSRMTVVATTDGISINGGDTPNTVSRSTIAANTFGIGVDGNASPVPDGTQLLSNAILGSSRNAIFLFNAPAVTVRSNVLQACGSDVNGECIRADGSNSIAPKGSPNGTFTGNRVSGSFVNGVSFLSASTGNVVTSNVFVANNQHGAFVSNTATGTSLTGNVLNENGLDGLHADSDITNASSNTADANGFLADPSAAPDGVGAGIQATPASTGTKNVAKNNDDPAQCHPTTPAICN